MDRLGPKWKEWTEQDEIGPNRSNVDRMDGIEPMWTE